MHMFAVQHQMKMDFALVTTITTVCNNFAKGVDNNINSSFLSQFHLISSSLQTRRKGTFRLIASFILCLSLSTLFYILEKKKYEVTKKKRSEESRTAERSALMETNRICRDFFLSLFLSRI